MSKIYVVISYCGEYEDYTETIEKAFSNFDKALNFMEELEAEEQNQRDLTNKCMNCNGEDRDCPMYAEPFYTDDLCESYNPWHDEVYYKITEVEYVE